MKISSYPLLRAQARKEYKHREWEKEVRFWKWDELVRASPRPVRMSLGDFKQSFGNLEDLEKSGLRFSRLESLPKASRKRALAMLQSPRQRKIDLWQLANTLDNFVVQVPAGCVVTLELKNRFFSCFTNVIFLVSKGAMVRVVEGPTPSQAKALGGMGVFISLAEGSTLDYIIDRVFPSNHQFAYHAFLAKDVRCYFYLTAQTKALTHGTVAIHHTGEGSFGKIVSALTACGSAKAYLLLANIHHQPHSRGEIVFKGIGSDESLAHVDGLIRIGDRAYDTDSFLSEHLLMLSGQSTLQAVPKLEIENNDVRASHSATIGHLDSESLYYLESRGIPLPRARSLLLQGFLKSLLFSIEDEEVRHIFQQKIDTHYAA